MLLQILIPFHNSLNVLDVNPPLLELFEHNPKAKIHLDFFFELFCMPPLTVPANSIKI